jgi:hypothetical protein
MRLFQDLSAAEELVFTFHLRLAKRDSEVPFREQPDVKKLQTSMYQVCAGVR